jgi:hypothetical protein
MLNPVIKSMNPALTPSPLPPHPALSYKEREKEVSFYWRGVPEAG